MSSVLQISRQQSRQIKADKADAFYHEGSPHEWEREPDDIDGFCEHVVLPDAARIAEIRAELANDDEAWSRVYESANRDLSRESLAWKALQWEAFIDDYRDAARIVAKEELA